MTVRRLLVHVAVLLVAVTSLAACNGNGNGNGNGDGGDATGDQTTTTAADTTTTAAGGDGAAPPPELEGTVNDRGTEQLAGDTLAMETVDFAFDPTFVQTERGASFTVELTNAGSLPHTFTIEGLDIDQVLNPGESAEVEVDLPDEDQVVFICRFHEAQGMRGAFYTG